MLKLIENQPRMAIWRVLIVAVAVCYIVRVVSSQWREFVRRNSKDPQGTDDPAGHVGAGDRPGDETGPGTRPTGSECRPRLAFGKTSGGSGWQWARRGAVRPLQRLHDGDGLGCGVSCNEAVQMLVDHETAPEEIVDQETAAEEINP